MLLVEVLPNTLMVLVEVSASTKRRSLRWCWSRCEHEEKLPGEVSPSRMMVLVEVSLSTMRVSEVLLGEVRTRGEECRDGGGASVHRV